MNRTGVASESVSDLVDTLYAKESERSTNYEGLRECHRRVWERKDAAYQELFEEAYVEIFQVGRSVLSAFENWEKTFQTFSEWAEDLSEGATMKNPSPKWTRLRDYHSFGDPGISSDLVKALEAFDETLRSVVAQLRGD